MRPPTIRFAVLAAVAALVVSACGDDDAATTTTTSTSVATTTTTAATTTTPPTTTSSTSTTTSSTSTTTTVPPPPFPGDTGAKTSNEVTGSPGALTDIRTGDHDGFTRVVFDFEGSGEHWWTVAYGDVLGGGSGELCEVEGSATLGVMAQPASAFWIEQTYFGPTEFGVDFDSSVVEIEVCDDFEAVLQVAIGVDGEKPFTVQVLQTPLRLVIDIAD